LTDSRQNESRGRAAGKKGAGLQAPPPPVPRHGARATRSAGQRMRSRLLDAATALFKAHGLAGASIGAIAGAADAFPSQVTYYFGTKEALFVEAACRELLHIAERTEKAGARARTPEAYARAIVDSVMGADGLPFFIEAMALARQRPDLAPQITRTLEQLHGEGVRAYAGEIARHGWRTLAPPDVSSRRFWTLALGIALEGYATGRSTSAMSAAMREALGVLAEAPDASGRPSRVTTR
jgi:AcrR family transcriptional regulator